MPSGKERTSKQQQVGIIPRNLHDSRDGVEAEEEERSVTSGQLIDAMAWQEPSSLLDAPAWEDPSGLDFDIDASSIGEDSMEQRSTEDENQSTLSLSLSCWTSDDEQIVASTLPSSPLSAAAVDAAIQTCSKGHASLLSELQLVQNTATPSPTLSDVTVSDGAFVLLSPALSEATLNASSAVAVASPQLSVDALPSPTLSEVTVSVVEQPFQPPRSAAAAPLKLSPMPGKLTSTNVNAAPESITKQTAAPARLSPIPSLVPIPKLSCPAIPEEGACTVILTGGKPVIAVPLSPSGSVKSSERSGTPRESDFGCADWQLDIFHASGANAAQAESSTDAWQAVSRRVADLEMQVEFWKARAEEKATGSPGGSNPSSPANSASEEQLRYREEASARRAGALEQLVVVDAFRVWRAYSRRLLEARGGDGKRVRIRRFGLAAAQARRAAERELIIAEVFHAWSCARQ